VWRYLPWVVAAAFVVGLVGRTVVFAGRGMVAQERLDGQKQWVAGKVIVLDPGHGGDDPGVIVSGIKEKDVILPVSLKTKAALEALGAKVIMTRDTDIDLGGKVREELSKRVDKVGEHGAQIYVSIHANKLNCNCWGAQTFYQRLETAGATQSGAGSQSGSPSQLGPGRLDQGKALAFAIQNQLRKWTPTTRTALQANYFVLRMSPVPAALVEVGFLSNSREAANLRDPAYQVLVANAIALGIADYFQQEGTSRPPE
jgi:N-acetylmuramoyl-L-alanine amidase